MLFRGGGGEQMQVPHARVIHFRLLATVARRAIPHNCFSAKSGGVKCSRALMPPQPASYAISNALLNKPLFTALLLLLLLLLATCNREMRHLTGNFITPAQRPFFSQIFKISIFYFIPCFKKLLYFFKKKEI